MNIQLRFNVPTNCLAPVPGSDNPWNVRIFLEISGIIIIRIVIPELNNNINKAFNFVPFLKHIINNTIAKNIVKYRDENGKLKERKELLKVPKLGKVAFEQCAGFLRIIDGKNPLEITAVHPESYEATEKLLKNFYAV